MSAPKALVRRVQEAADSHHPIGCVDHWDRCCCRCGRHGMTGVDARAHHAQAVADAAFTASLTWASLSPEPRHDDGCEERCQHCEVCGIGIMYGSRCHDHPITQAYRQLAGDS